MRKIILLSLLCLSVEMFAQKSFFGVEAGVNVANQRLLVDHQAINIGYTPGARYFQNTVRTNIGVFYRLAVIKQIGVQAKAQYSELGYKSEVDSRYDVNINYLTFPLSLHYKANDHLFLNVGSYISFTINNTKALDSYSNPQPVTTIYHKNDFGFSVGAEHDVYKNFAFAVNYLIGTKNIWLTDINGTFKYTNRALQFTLIYKFKKPS